MAAAAVRRRGFPRPDRQIPIRTPDGREVRRLDLGYETCRHAWEYDGEEHHGGAAAESRDRLRRDELERRRGWTVVGVGKALVLGQSLRLERAVGEVLGVEPALGRRRW